MKLYTISQDIKELEKILDEVESENLLKELEKVKVWFVEKLKNIWILIRSYEVNIVWIDEEIKRLTDLKKHYKNKVDGLKDYVAYAMQTAEKDKVETDLFKFSFRKSTSVDIFEEDKIPEDFTEFVEVKKIDKKGIWEALKSWKVVPWCQLREKKNLQIK